MDNDWYPCVCLWVSVPPHRSIACLAACDGQSYLAKFIRKEYPSGADVPVMQDGWTPRAGELCKMQIRFYTTKAGEDMYDILTLAPMPLDECSENEREDLYHHYENFNRASREKQKARRQAAQARDDATFGLRGVKRLKDRWAD